MKYKKLNINTSVKNSRNLLSVGLILLLSNCEEFTKVDPPRNSLTTTTVYETDAAATSAVSGIYREMMTPSNFTSGSSASISLIGGISSDEQINYSPDNQAFYTNSVTPQNSTLMTSLWTSGFKYIYYCNALLDGLDKSSALSSKAKGQLKGEAKFLRAFSYFYLTNMFGDLPLVTTTEYQTNMKIGKRSQTDIYQFIISDLNEAKELLPTDYSGYNNQKVRATKWSAAALLSRVYLYAKNWLKAEEESSLVINAGQFKLESDLNNIFLANSSEAIWQLMPIQTGYNTWDGITFILTSTPTYTSLTEEFINSIEPNDQRKSAWVGEIEVQGSTFYFPFKYKLNYNAPLTEYNMVIRLSELYLIRSEARANQDKLPEAIIDIDSIRLRAKLPLFTDANPNISKTDLLLALERERRVELFSEWGHRWFDLKRTNRAQIILKQTKGETGRTMTCYTLYHKSNS